jgi:hypothetical protein
MKDNFYNNIQQDLRQYLNRQLKYKTLEKKIINKPCDAPVITIVLGFCGAWIASHSFGVLFKKNLIINQKT